MIQKADPRLRQNSAVGADVGATLAKLVVRHSDGSTRFHLIPTRAIEQVAREVESAQPLRVGLTGGGAAELAQLLGCDTTRSDEFSAWRCGALELLREQAEGELAEPFLLVSLGTGTSALLVRDAQPVLRVGGTALGGGTLVGLGAALTGERNFDALIALACSGDRRSVDLLVSDIYPSGELPLPGDLNAASFAKLAHPDHAGRSSRADLAHAVVGMVGENIGMICGGLAAAAGVNRIVYGGATLRNNRPLIDVLRVMAAVRGQLAMFLEAPEFAGAVGALSLALANAPVEPL